MCIKSYPTRAEHAGALTLLKAVEPARNSLKYLRGKDKNCAIAWADFTRADLMALALRLVSA